MQRFMTEQGSPMSTDLWVKPQTNGYHEFILLFSILLQQGICVQVKIEKMVTATRIPLTTRRTRQNPIMCEVT